MAFKHLCTLVDCHSLNSYLPTFAPRSISFYPQIYQNWRRKSVQGLSFDFTVSLSGGGDDWWSWPMLLFLFFWCLEVLVTTTDCILSS